jgi:BirA family biotin operon repressor/biotin-[acetyl-CoA-carboxylase] ligase
MTTGGTLLAIPGAPPVEIFDTLDSTNAEGHRRIATGTAADRWIVARQQTGGRGRRGRTWVSEPGNLYASRIVSPRAPVARMPELSFVTGLAAYDAVAAHLDPAHGPIACKWPNDVLVKRRKVAGILLEGEGVSGWLTIGIGINVMSAPEGVEFPATSLRAEGASPELTDVIVSLVTAFERWYEIWRRDGFAPIREVWKSRAAGIGDTIRVRLESRELTGVFQDIAEDGALLLQLPNGVQERIAAGDVFFR